MKGNREILGEIFPSVNWELSLEFYNFPFSFLAGGGIIEEVNRKQTCFVPEEETYASGKTGIFIPLGHQ